MEEPTLRRPLISLKVILPRNSISPPQSGIRLSPLLRVIRAPRGVGALRTMTSGSPVPFTTVAEENIHAQGFLDPQFEFV